MPVSIVGAGAIAYGTAALLAKAGHESLLWSPSGKRTVDLAAGQPLVATGTITGSNAPHIASSIAEAIAEAWSCSRCPEMGTSLRSTLRRRTLDMASL